MLIKKMPARVESLHELLTFIRNEGKQRGLSDDTLNRIELVAEEALVNVFVHGYASPGEGQVDVRCLGSDNPTLTIEIRDKGIAFDPLSIADPDIESDIAKRKIGGMGVFLIRKMTDHVSYRRDAGSNILTMSFSNRSANGLQDSAK